MSTKKPHPALGVAAFGLQIHLPEWQAVGVSFRKLMNNIP